MDFICQYLSVDSATLERLLNYDNQALRQALEELATGANPPAYTMDMYWDGLHFLLTGQTLTDGADEDPLSQAVAGVYPFIEAEDQDEDDDVDFITYVPHDEMLPILEALRGIDLDELRNAFDPATMTREQVYPEVWDTEDPAELLDDMLRELESLTEFYEQAYATGIHIVVSIY